ncbi:hypothetical protein [Ramlibacter tataouinensis]|uniref:Uncharacterized protein n=1 Tax=Ramlibacter tataouinensis (strain ATCC BAA-407 / DSM 14655 / LMG 21543 / TTB310) TaxID=365046 RepID=F5Y397_RAMTT|nr:hypothetical protein [Ramlibacter tataouinensis]AEG91184.1 Hypothetical protein Rta_01210 [Ramlibacter tataouinensis TTB310]
MMKTPWLSTLAWLAATLLALLFAWATPPDAMLESFAPSAFGGGLGSGA